MCMASVWQRGLDNRIPSTKHRILQVVTPPPRPRKGLAFTNSLCTPLHRDACTQKKRLRKEAKYFNCSQSTAYRGAFPHSHMKRRP